MESQNWKLVILTEKEHDTPLFSDLEPENVFLRPENYSRQAETGKQRFNNRKRVIVTEKLKFVTRKL